MLSQLLREKGYHFDEKARVWNNDSSPNLDYSDGQSSELHALSVIQSAADLRTGSDDLASGIVDWPSTIHLSPERANLLRPICRILKGRILEVGPGAGALTRYLGESGAEVVAVEGNARRAEIAAQRCRDLPNVYVACDHISSFDLDASFDAIAMIGVLEYTRIFDEAPGAIERVLLHLRRLLKPDGHLIIGIENQLGLKYFAGAAEDHVNEPFFGISDLYGGRSAVTFGRRELRDRLQAAGFDHLEFLYPFPDYKLPRLVVPERTFSSAYLSQLLEVIRTVGLAGKQHYRSAFSENLAWRAIVRNGLSEDLANSFLIVASQHTPEKSASDPTVLAYSYSADRRRRFQIENRFVENGSGILVKRARLHPEEPPDFGSCRQQITDSDFITGNVYVNALHRIVQNRGWTISEIEPWAKAYFDFLRSNAKPPGGDAECATAMVLPESFVDCVPSNLILDSNGRMWTFDLEWLASPAPTLGWVLFRGLFYSLLHARAVASPADASVCAVLPIVLDLMCRVGCALDGNALNAALEREEQFQRDAVGERSILAGPFWHTASLNFSRFEESEGGIAEESAAGMESTLRANAAGITKLSSDMDARFRQVTGEQEYIRSELKSLTASLRESIEQQAAQTKRNEIESARLAKDLACTLRKLDSIVELEQARTLRARVTRTYDALVRLRRRVLFHLIAVRFQSNAQNREIVRKLRGSGLFDPDWYWDSCPDIKLSGVDPLLHYLLFGAAENRDPNPLFSNQFYIERNPDVAAAGINPLWHYLSNGAREGRNPHPDFDSRKYLDHNADVAEAEANPLAHYLLHGKHEGRSIHPVDCGRQKMQRPHAPQETLWTELRVQREVAAGVQPAVDVVIPVYRGLDDTLACIQSVLSAPVQTPYELVVVDDSSPEPELSAALARLADSKLIHLIRNDRNLGFVHSANRGMSLHPDRDVVLLNSDTLVYNDWLDRLQSAAPSEDRVGTVTPLSNNATICSYPRFVENNDTELELDLAELDTLTADVNAAVRIPIPTAVGFCMYIRRDCLAETGLFDAARFGKGYGEENDFCLRASKLGWQHMLAADVFVRHHGAVSFGASTKSAIADASKKLLERFPDYDALIRNFIQRDPVQDARRRLDIARLRRVLGDNTFLFFANSLGGGTDHHIQDLAKRLGQEGVGILFARSDRMERNLITLTADGTAAETPNLGKFDLVHDREPLADLIGELGVRLIHVQHIIGFDNEFVTVLPQLAAEAGIPFDVSLHDYTSICPRVFLVDGSDEYCGEPPVSRCEECVQRSGSRFGTVHVRSWRERFAQFLTKARRVYVPSSDVAARLRRYFPDVQFSIRPHPETILSSAAREYVRIDRQERRVAILGAVGRHKGYKLLRACAEDANRRNLPLRFVVIGYTENDKEMSAMSNVTISGKYEGDRIEQVLAEHPCDLAWFPAIWPETYSYTLSHAFRAGLFPVAFDLGAPAERIRAAQWGMVLPIEMAAQPKEINDVLLNVNIEPAKTATLDWGTSYGSLLVDYYAFDPSASAPDLMHSGAVNRR